jgi:hypothetical protein
MTSKANIISAISTRIGNSKTVNYSAWRIGLTHDVQNRHNYWKNDEGERVDHWLSWEADSLADAQDIENYFINTKKMKGGTGGDLSHRKTVFVYIF